MRLRLGNAINPKPLTFKARLVGGAGVHGLALKVLGLGLGFGLIGLGFNGLGFLAYLHE